MTTVALAGAAVVLVAWLRTSLISGLDQTAWQRAQAVAEIVNSGNLHARLPSPGDRDIAAQVVDSKGTVRSSSPNLEGNRRVFTFAPSASDEPHARSVQHPPHSENGIWRAVAIRAGTPSAPMTVYAAVLTEDVDNSLAKLTRGLAIGVPMAVTALTSVAWLLTGRALRPVEMLRAQTAEITVSDLSRRLDVPPSADALGRLATTLNDLLARLEASTQKQRQFIADASHELRSPLSSLHTQLEVAARNPDSADWRSLGPVLVEDSERLSLLVDDLVRLARLDAHPRFRRRPVDLDEIVFAEVQRARQRTNLTIDQHTVSAARVDGDVDALTRVVRNLLDNAIRYATLRIDVNLGACDGTAQLVVSDDGLGIPGPDRQRVFDRFTRLDDARARDTGGSGLGLAIVRDIITVHRGTVHVEDNAPGARLVVRLPLTRL
ncbi:HAMP domain-containing sensor histidine kinase [Streptomyces aureus]|uniref:HAMP domain-containing sensor histidine kinase n=1 Tax=Streptomyces aureus TaxID=193461 RepID=UPI0031D5BE3E